MKRTESSWHKLTVETVQFLDEGVWADDVDRHVEHPADCDLLKYGETCWFDGQFFELCDDEDLPVEPGVYRARVWSEGPDYFGEYDGGSEWEPMPTEGAETVAPESGVT